MHVEISPQLFPKRGANVAVGNVYANNRPPAFKNFRVVVGIATNNGGRTIWANIICIHIGTNGSVVGCSANPSEYVKNHWDLIGRVKKMPTMKIEWIKAGEYEECPPSGSKSTHQNGLSNNQAKRKLGKKRGDGVVQVNIARGAPVAGTGKPKGATK